MGEGYAHVASHVRCLRLIVARSGFLALTSDERVAAVNRNGRSIVGSGWTQMEWKATKCDEQRCSFTFKCDCKPTKACKQVRVRMSGASSSSSQDGGGTWIYRTWTEILEEIVKFIHRDHVKANCSLSKRPANWLAAETEKKARTDNTEKLRTEEEQIHSLSKRVHSLEKSLDNRIDEAEVTRRKGMPIDPTNHEGFDYPTAEGASRFGRIRARAQNTEHSMRALIRCVFHSMHMYSHGISMYVCHRQTEQRASLQRDCPSKEI